EPMYVTEIRPDSNTVVLGSVQSLLRNGMTVGQVNSMKYPTVPVDGEFLTQIRYNDPGTLARVTRSQGDQVDVEFMANVRGVAPGQSAVLYEGDDVVGGGLIYASARKV
ncbi:MAG: aminomethyltransferase beta-barrel domain-containing protein, partial [Bacteroidota bacterium]